MKVGDIIDSDTIIGLQGNTGLVLSKKARTNITYGTHVHFEVINEEDNHINPREYALFNIEVNYIEQTNEIDYDKTQIKIIANKINIRENSSTHSNILGVVVSDEIYTVLDKVVDDRYVWYKIRTNRGVTGYVASEKTKNWLKIYNDDLDNHQVEEENEIKFIFECEKDGVYAIKLKKGEKMFIE